MNEEIIEYQKYLLNFGVVKKTIMPEFDVSAYTDSEYTSALFESLNAFDFDDEYLTLMHLKGE